MSQIIRINSSSGSLLIEADGIETRQRASSSQNVIDKLDIMFDILLQDQIVKHCELFTGAFNKLKEMEKPPTKASAEFGLKFNGEGNLYVVKVAAEANFKINFEWKLD